MNILVLNSGSSSIKFSVFMLPPDTGHEPRLCCRGELEGIGGGQRKFTANDAGGCPLDVGESLAESTTLTHDRALEHLLRWLQQWGYGDNLAAVGHRVVHGGSDFTAPVRIDAAIMKQLEALIPLAPLHQPHNLAAIGTLTERYPSLIQIACFDTAFHAAQPEVARRFALPRHLTEAGIKRYGFHGLSYEYVSRCLTEISETPLQRVIVAHLGNGASMCALHNGKSLATSMGFTALDGLPMGTRCGALDPGVILHLLEVRGISPAEVSDLLYRRSGLLGVSGISNDMRELLASTDPHAREAVDLFIYRINRELGSLTAALGGLDALVFTGGIGENSAQIRARVCAQAQWLGIRLNADANECKSTRIHALDSSVEIWVIPTNEEQMIAQSVCGMCHYSGVLRDHRCFPQHK